MEQRGSCEIEDSKKSHKLPFDYNVIAGILLTLPKVTKNISHIVFKSTSKYFY